MCKRTGVFWTFACGTQLENPMLFVSVVENLRIPFFESQYKDISAFFRKRCVGQFLSDLASVLCLMFFPFYAA